MSEIKGIILGLCAASLVLGAVYMLRPKSNVEKSIRFAFAVVFLSITVVSGAGILKKDIKIADINVNADFISTAEELTRVQAEYLAEQVLLENGCEFQKISVLTDKSVDGGIFIKRVTVISRYNPEEIRQSILSVIETDGVEVINE